MRLSSLLLPALLAPTLLAAQPATRLVTTDARTAQLGPLLEGSVAMPHRLRILPGDTLLWETPDLPAAVRVPLREVEVYVDVSRSQAGLRCRTDDCIRTAVFRDTARVEQYSWGFYRKVTDASALMGWRVVADAELVERGEDALAELVAAVAGPAQRAERSAAARLVAALWNPTRVLPIQNDTLVVVEDERWTYRIPLSRVVVEESSEYSQVGFRCQNAADCVRVSQETGTYRLPWIAFNVHASKRAAALEALHAIVRAWRDGG